jgi:Fe-S cluster biogenesis protein NfuA
MSSDPLAAGDRIETLLAASAASGRVAHERAEELVRIVADLYGGGLERLLEIMHERGHLTDDVLDALAGDELVAGLLLVHGLHPYPVSTRIEQALRPHRGEVELLEIGDDGVVRLRMVGGGGCGCSADTVKVTVEEAIEAAAPEVTAVEIVDATPVIPVSSLFSRVGGLP